MSETNLTPEQIKNIRDARDEAFDRDQAYTAAANETARRIRGVVESIDEMNFGMARAALEGLLEELPNDFGGPVTHHRLFKRHYTTIRERRAARAA